MEFDDGIKCPAGVKEDLYAEGYRHALAGGNLTHVTHLKYSFREGFRAGKLFLRERRASTGIIDFPMKGKIKVKVK